MLGGFIIGAAILTGFFVWELKCANPMLDVRFFENPRFSAASGAITLAFLALFGTIFLLTQYTQQVLGYTTVEAGAIFLPQSIVLMIFAPMSTRWVRMFGNKAVVATGLFVLAVALALMATFQTDSSAYLVVGITALSAFGMAHVVAPATESIMGSLPPRQGRRRLGHERHHPPGGRCRRRGVARIDPRVRVPSARRATSCRVASPVPCSPGRKTHWGARWAWPGTSRRRVRTPRASSSAAQTSFVNGMHAAVLVAAAIAVIGGIGVLVWLPAHARPHPDDVDEIEHEMEIVTDDALTASATPAGGVMVMRWISLVPSPMHRSGRVAVVALDVVLGRVAVRAVDAQGLGGVLQRGLRCHQLGHPRLEVAALAAIERTGGTLHEQPRRLDPACHVGQLERDRLVLDDRPAHRLPLLRVPQRRRQRGVGHPHAARGDVDATELERTDRLVETAALHPSEEVVLGHRDVVEHDLAGVDALVPELAQRAGHRVPEVLGHDEQRHAPVSGLGAHVGLHEHREAVALHARS